MASPVSSVWAQRLPVASEFVNSAPGWVGRTGTRGFESTPSEVSSPNRWPRALVGAFIGAAAGLVVCTAISNLSKDRGTGFTTCTSKGYVQFALGGIAIGFGVGWLTKH